jgi:disulfide bond formation protein DsbB
VIPVRRAITVLAVVVLLAGPTALAFSEGGYFDPARLIAGIVTWVLLGVAALVSPQPLPRGRGGRLALGGLVLLTVWSGASIAWAPLSAPATDALQRLLLYVAALGAAAALLRQPAARRAVEPALALGTLVVIGYGLSERLLPGLVTLKRSNGALGRLEQPLTYWNATGALAAVGALLCVRVAGDPDRSRWMRPPPRGACRS